MHLMERDGTPTTFLSPCEGSAQMSLDCYCTSTIASSFKDMEAAGFPNCCPLFRWPSVGTKKGSRKMCSETDNALSKAELRSSFRWFTTSRKGVVQILPHSLTFSFDGSSSGGGGGGGREIGAVCARPTRLGCFGLLPAPAPLQCNLYSLGRR
jgi:hypothetical protein